jgi:hypothetical protein
MADEKQGSEQQAEETDLEVEEEQADEVEGGRRRFHAPEEQGQTGPAPQPLKRN